jgi:hypothetical protein
LNGYAALKALLMVDLGSFALVVSKPTDKLSVDRSINIEIKALLEKMDNLPDEPSALFDQESLLNKVFSARAEFELQPSAPAALATHLPNHQGESPAAKVNEAVVDPSQDRSPNGTVGTNGRSEPEMLAGVRELVSGRFNKPPAPSKRPPSGQLRGASGGGHLQVRKALRLATIPTIATISVMVMATVVWKVLTPISSTNRHQAKNSPPSAVRTQSAASYNKAHQASLGRYFKRLEGTARAKQRSAIEKRKL